MISDTYNTAVVGTEFFSAKDKNLQMFLKDSNSQTRPFQQRDLAEHGAVRLWSNTSANLKCSDNVQENAREPSS